MKNTWTVDDVTFVTPYCSPHPWRLLDLYLQFRSICMILFLQVIVIYWLVCNNNVTVKWWWSVNNPTYCCSVTLFWCFFSVLFVYVYWKSRWQGETDRDLSYGGSLPTCSQQPVLDHSELESLKVNLGLAHRWQGPNYWTATFQRAH